MTEKMWIALINQAPEILLLLALCILLLCLGKKNVRNLLNKANIKISAGKLYLDLKNKDADKILTDFLDEFAQSYKEVSPQDLKLFQRIYQDEGSKSVKALESNFNRPDGRSQLDENLDTPTRVTLDRLRRLRSLNLIRPKAGAYWENSTVPVLSEFSKYVIAKNVVARKALLGNGDCYSHRPAKSRGFWNRLFGSDEDDADI